MRTSRLTSLAVIAALALGACGGNEGTPQVSSDDADPTVPVTAAAATNAPGRGSQLATARLGLRGLGPVTVGMTVDQAAQAAGTALAPMGGPDAGTGCEYVRPEGAPDGIGFMVIDGVIARVDIIAGTVATDAGVTIGLTEAHAQRLYDNRLDVSPHNYTEGGHDLTLVPAEVADKDFRVVLETDGTNVTAMRGGRLPEVEWVEGCG